MKKSIFIVSLLLFVLLTSSFISKTDVMAAEPEYKLVFGLMVSENDPFTNGARYFAKEVENRTNGKVKIDVYPGGILGDNKELWEGVQQGTIDLVVDSPCAFVSEYYIFGLPFLFKSIEHRDTIVNSKAMEKVNKILEEKGNVVPLGVFGVSTRNLISTKKPILSLDDLKGVRMRTWPNKLVAETWETLGAACTVVAYSEVYTALQLGVVEAAENENSTFVTQKWYEPSKYITRTQHCFNIRSLMMGANKFYSLPKDIQKILREVGKEAEKYESDVEKQMNSQYEKEMEEYGIKFVDLKDKEKWINATEGVRKKYIEQYGLEEIYTEIIKLGE